MITSKFVLDNLYTILHTTLFYQIVYLIGAYIVVPPLSKLKINYDENHAKNEEVRSHIRNNLGQKDQASNHFISFLQTLVVLYLSYVFFLNPNVCSTQKLSKFWIKNFWWNPWDSVCMLWLAYFIWDTYISSIHSSVAFIIQCLLYWCETIFTILRSCFLDVWMYLTQFLNIKWYVY